MFGLYYPHVRFRDERWLKTTALYWDRMYRLFSDEERYDSFPNVSRTEAEFSDAGFVRRAQPGDEVLRRATKGFARVLETMDLDRYRLTAPDAAPEPLLDYVANWKVSGRYLDELVDQGLAIRDDRHWRLLMHPALAHAYLLVLGRELAADYGASAVSDEEAYQAAGGQDLWSLVATSLDGEGVNGSPAARQPDLLLVNLAVEAVLPRDVDAVRPDQILRFRETYAGERVRFREQVEGMLRDAVELDRVRDRDVLMEHLQARYDTRIEPALTDLRRALRGQGIETVLSAMDLQVAAPPAVATGLAAFAMHASAPVTAAMAGVGFAAGVWRAALRDRRARAADLVQSPVAYLHHLQTDLAPETLLDRVRGAVARIGPGR